MRQARSLARTAACAAALAMAMASGDARADAPGDDATPLAEALFQQGRDLFKHDRYAEACPKFAESQRLQPKLGTLLNLALCHEKIGKVASAWAEYTSAATIAHRAGEKEREDFARGQVAALSKKLSHVTLRVSSPPPGLVVTLDDKPLEEAALNIPLPVDPGTHRLAATAPRMRAWSGSFDIPVSQADLPVEIPALEHADDPGAAPPPAAASSPPAAAPPPSAAAPPATASMPPAIAPVITAAPAPPPAPSQSTARTIAYVGFGVGGAGLLLGAITGAMALGKSGAVIDACPGGHCPVDQRGELSTVNALANASNVGFALGAVGVGVGIVGILVARPSDAAPATKASITPILGPGAVGIRGAF